MSIKKEMDKGILTNADIKLTKYKLLYGVIFALLFMYCIISLIPVLWVLLSGFKDVKELYSTPVKFFPSKIDVGKLTRVWSEMKFYRYYLSTFIMAGGCVLFTLIVDGIAGYTLSRLRPAGTKLILTILFWVMLLPGTMRTVPLYMEFKSFPVIKVNMLNSFWPIWLMAATNVFNIILFKNFFDGISKSIIEAAKIDGASNISIFFRIVFPLSVPVFMTVAIFTFNGNMGTFFWPYLLIDKKELTVLGVHLFNMKSSTYTMDYQMLALLFSIFPQVVVFLLFQKNIMGGINIGGVKG